MGFFRQKYWSGLTFPSPGDIPDPGIQTHVSCITGRFFTIWATREAHSVLYISLTFIFLDSKITADGDCSHEIKRLLLLGRKAVTNLDSILKSRDITLSTKVHLIKARHFNLLSFLCETVCPPSLYHFPLLCHSHFLSLNLIAILTWIGKFMFQILWEQL